MSDKHDDPVEDSVSAPERKEWRVGDPDYWRVYEGNRLVATFDKLDAAQAVVDHNEAPALRAEVERLRDIVTGDPRTAYLDAVQRACDERMVTQKHQIRQLEAALRECNKYPHRAANIARAALAPEN